MFCEPFRRSGGLEMHRGASDTLPYPFTTPPVPGWHVRDLADTIQAKKPRASLNATTKKRRVIASSDDDSDAVAAPAKAAPMQIKPEPSSAKRPTSNGKPAASRSYSDDSDLSEDDKPLAASVAKKTNGKAQSKKKSSATPSDSDDSDFSDEPLAKKKGAPKPRLSAASASASTSTAAKSKTKVKKEYTSSEDEKPLAKKVKTAPKAKSKVKEASSSEEERPLAAKGKKATPAASSSTKKPAVKKEKKVKEEEEEEEKFKWWEQADGDDTVKWTTLEHNAVLFPPPYVPLPRDVKMKYDGQPLTLPPESEEVAGFYGAMLGTDHVEDKTFQANFFRDFKATLDEYPPVSLVFGFGADRLRVGSRADGQKEGVKVTSLEKCDFRPMYEHFEREREKKKSMTKEEKKA